MNRFFGFLAAVLIATGAQAQVRQSGNVTPGHAVKWLSPGVIGDAGTAASGSLTSVGVTNNGGPAVCVNSGPITGPYNQLCFSSTTNGGTKISSYVYNGATSPGFVFDVNGTTQSFPVFASPVVDNNVTCFLGTAGTIKDCGYPNPVTTPLAVNHGGTNCSAASGTCLDNITAFSSTGLIRRTGAGTYTFGTPIANADLATMAADTIKCNNTTGSATPIDCTVAQAKTLLSTPISVTDPAFGAKCDGTTDDTAAFQAAVDTGKYVTIPAGTCRVDGPFTISVPGTRLSGAGPVSTILTSQSTTNNQIILAAGISLIEIDNFKLTRSVTASGGAGIAAAGDTETSRFHDLIVEKQLVGLSLGSCATPGYIYNVMSQFNQSDGFDFTNSASVGGIQWELYNVFSAQNGGRGYAIAAGVAGPSQITLGSWVKVFTFANSSYGIQLTGSPGLPIEQFRLTDAFIGSDGNSSIYLDTYNTSPHQFVGVNTELAGQTTTGPTNSTAASGVGSGFEFTANNGAINVTGAASGGHSINGLRSAASKLSVTGGSFLSNGRAASNGGINITAASNVRITGVVSNATPQSTGITLAAAVINAEIIGNDVSGTGGGITNSSTGVVHVCSNTGGGTLDCTSAWNTFTPSPACGTATITTNTAHARTFGKTTYIEADFTITVIGTCTGNLSFTIPVTAQGANAINGQEITNGGKGISCNVATGSSTVQTCRHSDGTSLAVNDHIVLSGVIESQ